MPTCCFDYHAPQGVLDRAFALWDSNGDGTIDIGEFKAIVHALVCQDY